MPNLKKGVRFLYKQNYSHPAEKHAKLVMVYLESGKHTVTQQRNMLDW